MNIHFTEQAIDQIVQQLQSYEDSFIFLSYELGGCGNPLDGAVRLQLFNKKPKNTRTLETNSVPVYINSSAQMHLEKDLMIDFQSTGYLIKSNNQIYGYSLKLERINE
ncbi:iron-sulfur cluster biosynthesis family protein [Saliterribacillus persicus]|uniref:Uncharacterized protein YqkB n=1 Tax=Saliterribacillus persicus TaxID=930114 RepID=A0A368XXV5_9BACI|nr:iron-sulfur cluster biosynthesis family protein [Saliterribacillus persicus]RCW71966.1 uncharacterized protein YqkB [Saliterribacillus persicus]